MVNDTYIRKKEQSLCMQTPMLYEEVNTVSKSDIARLINIFFKDELLQLSHEKCNAKSTVQQFEARRNVDM